MFGGAIGSNIVDTEKRARSRADRRGGNAACEEYGDGGEDTDAEVGFCGERGLEALHVDFISFLRGSILV